MTCLGALVPAIIFLSPDESEPAPWAPLSPLMMQLYSVLTVATDSQVLPEAPFGVTPDLLPLARESLCLPSFHNHLLQAPEPSPQQLSISVSRHREPCGFLAYHTTHMCQPKLALCPATPAATLIDPVALLCYLLKWRMGRNNLTPTFIF